MLKCAATNVAYMRATPAGRQGYGALVKLYESIAGASLNCAREWADDNPCPPHQPAVDAFWWAVAVWAVRFTTDVVGWAAPPREGLLLQEVQEVFTRPHIEFASWLRPVRPGDRVSEYPFVTRWPPNPGLMILAHDIAWTRAVIRLTARWGLVHHLKDLRALGQSVLLIHHLSRGPRNSTIARAYLGSDLVFFRRLFRHFDFSPELRGVLDRFLAAADEQTGQN
ncbi:hypothetical protein LCGC14_0744490 [marine sediment metagenome]|uniref:Uncharacterized protein n=1 Tax=marine sediment metagenome TaxID=412755 RepID=A0A0F9QA17_9ZZZZ